MGLLNLTLTLNSNGSITARWSAVSNVARYTALMVPVGSSAAIYYEKDLHVTSYTSKSNLAANQQYRVTVTAILNTGQQGASEAATILIPSDFYDNQPLDVPQNVRATATTNTVTVSFSAVNRAAGYDILFDNQITNVRTTSRTFSGLTPKTNHTYAVRARNTKQTGAYSATGSIQTLPLLPAVPSGIKKSATEKSASISWNAVSGATGYDITFNGSTYSTTSTSKSFTGLSAGISYQFKIRSKNRDGASVWTSAYTVTTPPGAPASVSAESTDTTVTVTWGRVSAATGYILRFQNKDTNLAASAVSYKFTGLSPKTSYSYQICCKSADGTGSFGKAATVKTKAALPAVPSGIRKSSTENTVTLTWNAASLATGYNILFRNSTYNVSDLTKTFIGLSNNTSYTYQIRSVNADGTSAYTAVQTVKTTPAAPSGSTLTAAANENSITVGWNAVSGATGYDLMVAKLAAGEKITATTGVSAKVSGLLPDTAYDCRLRVKNTDGVSSWGSAKTVRTTPACPSGIQVSAAGNSVTVSWDAVSGASSYELIFNKVSYRVYGTSRTIYGLTPSTSYQYQVCAVGKGGSSSYSTARTVTTLPAPPAVPGNISATSTINSITVTWGSVSGASGYELFLNNTTYSTNYTSYTVGGLTSDLYYTYQVRAKNAGGYSSYSSVKGIRTKLQAPGVPTGVTATATYDSATVQWDKAARATEYELLFNRITYSTAATMKTVTGLAENTGYSYQVRAKNAAGASGYSAAGTIRTTVRPPAVPGQVKAAATATSLTVSWNAVSGAVGYEVLFNGNSYDVGNAISKTFTGLSEGTDYSYQVRARNAGGYSPYSETTAVTTIPARPSGIRADMTADSLRLAWEPCKGADGYRVRFGSDTYDVEGTSKEFTGLAPDSDYSYSVSARNASGESSYSDTVKAHTLLPTPLGLMAIPAAETMLISWHAVEGATGYDLVFDGMVYSLTETSKEITGLTPLSEHTFSVRAKNAGAFSAYSRTMKAMTLDGLPQVPRGIRASATMNSVTVSWLASDDADSYEVAFDEPIPEEGGVPARSRQAESARMWQAQAASDGPAARGSKAVRISRTFTGLYPGTEHTYAVRAKNKYGYSPYSRRRKIWTETGIKNNRPRLKRRRTYPDGRKVYRALDPVNALTGAFVWNHTFLADYGKDALDLTLYYDSADHVDHVGLGAGWTHTFGYTLQREEDYYYFTTPSGEGVSFHSVEDRVSLPSVDAEQGFTLEIGENGDHIVKEPDGTVYTFDSEMCLAGISENGQEICRFVKDETGHITGAEGRHGGRLTFTYTDGMLTGAADAMGKQAVFVQEAGCLTQAGIGSDRMRFGYDEDRLLVSVGDFAGNPYLRNEYDDAGRIISQNLAGRGTAAVSYDEQLRVTTFTDESGHETKYYYDENGHIIKTENAGSSTENLYNTNGQIIQEKDALGAITRMEYDSAGRMNRITYPDGTSEQTVYNDRNLPTQMTGRDGTESLFTYDEYGRLTAAQNERGYACSYAYDEKDNLTSYTDREGNVWTYTYDENDHLSAVQDPQGNAYTYTHDAIGRLLSAATPAGDTVSYEYAQSGELLRITDGDGSRIFTYDKNGNRTSVTDRMGSIQRLEYNDMGQVSLATDFMGKEYHFAYDAQGRLIRETDPLGYAREYAYDGRGNRISEKDANGAVTEYSFDAADRLIYRKDAADGTVRYTYDLMGQVSAVTDPLGHITSYTYDQAGRVLSETDPLGHSVLYTYDGMGNVLTKTDEEGRITAYTYDKEDRLLTIETAGYTTAFTYDTLGRLILVTDRDSQTQKAAYDADGRLTAAQDQEGHTTAYAYDSAGRLTKETAANGAVTLYTYDNNGNCTEITDAEGNTVAAHFF